MFFRGREKKERRSDIEKQRRASGIECVYLPASAMRQVKNVWRGGSTNCDETCQLKEARLSRGGLWSLARCVFHKHTVNFLSKRFQSFNIQHFTNRLDSLGGERFWISLVILNEWNWQTWSTLTQSSWILYCIRQSLHRNMQRQKKAR